MKRAAAGASGLSSVHTAVSAAYEKKQDSTAAAERNDCRSSG